MQQLQQWFAAARGTGSRGWTPIVGTPPTEPEVRFYRSWEEPSPLAGINLEAGHAYSATVSAEQSYAGGKSLRLELRSTDADVSGSRRVELNLGHAAQRKEWYAFAFYLPSSHYATPDPHAEQLCQWHAVPDAGEDWGSPAKSVQLVNNRLRVRVAYNDAPIARTPLGEQLWDSEELALDAWHVVVVETYHDHRTAANGGQGVFRLWHNDVLWIDHTGPNAWNDQLLPYFKLGCYKWPWATDYGGQYVTPGCDPRVLYFDEVKIGGPDTTYDWMRPRRPVALQLRLDTTDPLTLTGWEDQVQMTNASATGGTILVQNRRFRSLNSDIAALDFGEGASGGVGHIIIENCDFYGAGFMIKSWYNNNRITIRNCRFWGAPVTAWTSYKKTRRIAKINGATEVVIENCFMKGTAGISMDTLGADVAKLHVRYNVSQNIDGRVGGDTYEHSQFLQVVGRGRTIADCLVEWNYILNEPNRSWVEDTINFYNVGGLPENWARVQHNFLKGAFYDPFDRVDPYYSGGGIIMDSSHHEGQGQIDSCCRYVDIADNYVLGSNNYSISVCTGHHISILRNVSAAKGYLDAADTARIGGAGRLTGDPSGNNVRDFYAPGVTSDIIVDGNRVGVFRWNGTAYERRPGFYTDVAGIVETGRQNLATVDEAAEQALLDEWLGRAHAQGITLGAVGDNEGETGMPEPTVRQYASFDGVNDYIEVPNTNGLLDIAGGATVDFWLETSHGIADASGWVFSFEGAVGTEKHFAMCTGSYTGTLTDELVSLVAWKPTIKASIHGFSSTDPAEAIKSKRVHVAVVVTTTDWKLYLNSVDKPLVVATGSTYNGPRSGTWYERLGDITKISIGRRLFADQYGAHKVEHFRVWNEAKDAAGVTELMENNTGQTGLVLHLPLATDAQDISGNNLHGTAYNGVTFNEEPL